MNRIKTLLTAALTMVATAGCSGVGDGVALETLSITPLSFANGEGKVRVFECVRNQLASVGTFTNGSQGVYTDRARWSSDNTNIVKVSNAGRFSDPDDFLPDSDTLVLSDGTLTPVAPGTTIVRATFAGLQSEIEVTVVDLQPTDFVVTPTNPTMAPGSIAHLQVAAKLDGVLRDISASASFSLPSSDDAVLKLEPIKDSDDNILSYQTRGIAPGGPVTVQAKLSACESGANAIAPSTTVQVKPIASLAMQREFPGANELVLGTSEVIKVIASFDGGATQDLSTQYDLLRETEADKRLLTKFTVDAVDNDPTHDVAFAFAVATGFTNLMLSAIKDIPVTVSGKFAPTNPAGLAAVTATGGFQITAVSAVLNGVTVSSDATIAPLGSHKFVATGQYTVGTGDAARSLTQDISRYVVWSTKDVVPADPASTLSTIASVTNFPLSGVEGGLVTSLKNEAGSAIVTASNPGATDETKRSDTATLTVTAPAP